MSAAAERLSRLLAMVPWLLERPGTDLDETAAHFRVTPAQVERDLELLFVCGAPGHLPGDLIEATWEDGRIYLGNADAIDRPLRLGVDEAVALVAGLRALAEVPGLHDDDLVTSTLAKLAAAAGEDAAAADDLRVSLAAPGTSAQVLADARRAVALGRRVHLSYLVPSRDDVTERDVDPVRVTTSGDHWYLVGWCHRAEASRSFRLDRILHLTLTDHTAATHPAPPPATGPDLFTPDPGDPLVTVDLAPRARWVAETYPVEDVQELPDGHLRAGLRAADPDRLLHLALRLGGDLRVLAPAGLAARVHQRAAAALAAYPDRPGSDRPDEIPPG